MIYADFESITVSENNGKRNPENSWFMQIQKDYSTKR